jgi:DNA-directed RNA polymerase subunit RPC12/RpoP
MKFSQKLASFFFGRYGADQLYNALFAAELVLLFIGTVLSILGKVEPVLGFIAVPFYLLALGLLGFAMFRFFSRNIAKRRRENEAWLRFKAKFRRKPKVKLPPDTSEHTFRACPKCNATLRLPRQKGKHTARCPRCGHAFGVKVK